MKRMVLLAGMLAVFPATAQQVDLVRPVWNADAELGAISTSGNRETTTVNARFNAVHESPEWRNRVQVEYLQASDAAGATARRTVAQAATNYKLDRSNYLFANLRYEQDRFAGYDYRVSETVGYGRRFHSETQKLDLEAGAGGRHAELLDGDREDDGIVRVAGAYQWRFSETGEFSEAAFSEISSDNAHSESETALKLKINGRLAMKLSFKLLHDSAPAPGALSTDTITAVTLVYDLFAAGPAPAP